MAWFKIDDRFTFHPKVLLAGNEAIGAWVRLGAYCGAHLTDGKLPAAIVISVCGPELAARLVAARFLEQSPDGMYVMHDYLEYNPSAQQVRAERAATADRVARWRNGSRNGVTTSVSNGSPDPDPDPDPDPIRSFPDPNQPTDAALAGWLAAEFERYPKQADQARGNRALLALTPDERQAFTKAVDAYVRFVAEKHVEWKYQITWPIFCEKKWRTYVPKAKKPKPEGEPASVFNLKADPPPKKAAQ